MSVSSAPLLALEQNLLLFSKDFLLKYRCQKYGPRVTTVEFRIIIGGGDYFSSSTDHSESSPLAGLLSELD